MSRIGHGGLAQPPHSRASIGALSATRRALVVRTARPYRVAPLIARHAPFAPPSLHLRSAAREEPPALTWPAVPPYPALRIPRTAVGRRALQVALLVGGLFALGFLCAGQASAAEPVPTATATAATSARIAPVDGVRSLVDGAVERLAKPPAEPEMPDEVPGADVQDTVPQLPKSPKSPKSLESLSSLVGGGDDSATVSGMLPAPVGDVQDQVLRPVTEQVVGVVESEVLQPVGDVVETVTEQLAEAQAELPVLPGLSEMPGLPEVPGVPARPSLPELPELPVQTLPVTTPTQPEAPAAGSSDGDGDGGGGGHDSARRSGEAAAALFHGPPSVAGSPTTGTAARAGGQRAAQAAHLPVQQAPDGDSGGAPGNRSTADSGSSRHADAHAVSLDQRAPVRLVAGAAAQSDAAVTRDRHRDIPVSPA
jgi:hypothetical protein